MEGRAMELMDTVNLMNSSDYKERFAAEYWQTKVRYEKLRKMCADYEKGELPFTPTCSIDLLHMQLSAMDAYLHCLEKRAEVESVKLYGISL